MAAAPGPSRAFRLSDGFTGAQVQGDSVAAAAAFLLDAARSEVSARTVLLVLQHWVDEGMTSDEVRHAVAVADESCPLRHRLPFNDFREAIANRFGLALD